MDTIFALATAPGKAGVAVIRVSGPLAVAAATALDGKPSAPRMASLRLLTDREGGRLDEALVLWFEQDRSFTGEEVIEFQLHGSTAIVAAVMRVLGDIDGLRLAEPGEFTRRALENGRMDLAQVEGLADLIEAETEAQRRQALRVLAGDLGDRAEEWRRDLIRAAALLEATIDFADEDVPTDVTPEVSELLQRVSQSLSKEAKGVATAERIRSGFEVAIVGAPNVGKSTLLNALAGREAAITSEFAGTTRDVIEVRMDLAGLAVTLLDTAGIRDTTDHVEGIGIERAISRASEADLRVFLVEGDDSPEMLVQSGDIILKAKADRLADTRNAVSGRTGHGVESLLQRVSQELTSRAGQSGLAIRERHRTALEKAVEVLTQAQEQLATGAMPDEIIAEEIRTAIRALDSLVGRVDVENLLDEIFSSFCLGK